MTDVKVLTKTVHTYSIESLNRRHILILSTALDDYLEGDRADNEGITRMSEVNDALMAIIKIPE